MYQPRRHSIDRGGGLFFGGGQQARMNFGQRFDRCAVRVERDVAQDAVYQRAESRAGWAARQLWKKLDRYRNQETGWRLRCFRSREDVVERPSSLLQKILPRNPPGAICLFSLLNVRRRLLGKNLLLAETVCAFHIQRELRWVPPDHTVLAVPRHMESRLDGKLAIAEILRRTIHHRGLAELGAARPWIGTAPAILRRVDRFVERTDPPFERLIPNGRYYQQVARACGGN